MTYKYFIGCRNLEETKVKYRALAKSLHPDKGGSSSDFADMKNEYDYIVGGDARFPITAFRPSVMFNPDDVFQAFRDMANMKGKQSQKGWEYTVETELDFEKLDKERADRFFAKVRKDNEKLFKLVDLAKASKKEFKEVMKVLNRSEDSTIEVFKYVLYKYGKDVKLASSLYNIYITNKAGW